MLEELHPGRNLALRTEAWRAGDVKGYFATRRRTSWRSGEAMHGARCLTSAATNREEPCRAPCVRAAGEGSPSRCPCCWEQIK